MITKSKKTIVLLIVFGLSLSTLPVTASAQIKKQDLSSIGINSKEGAKVSNEYNNAPAIRWRYKSEDGKVYRRQYNYSRQTWIGEWEEC